MESMGEYQIILTKKTTKNEWGHDGHGKCHTNNVNTESQCLRLRGSGSEVNPTKSQKSILHCRKKRLAALKDSCDQ